MLRGQKAVEAIFHKENDNGKRKEDVPKASTQHNPKKSKKKKAQQGQDETLATDLVAAAEKRNPPSPPKEKHRSHRVEKSAINQAEGREKGREAVVAIPGLGWCSNPCELLGGFAEAYGTSS